MMAGRLIALKAQQPIIVIKALVQYYTVAFQIYKHSSVVRTLGKKVSLHVNKLKQVKLWFYKVAAAGVKTISKIFPFLKIFDNKNGILRGTLENLAER